MGIIDRKLFVLQMRFLYTILAICVSLLIYGLFGAFCGVIYKAVQDAPISQNTPTTSPMLAKFLIQEFFKMTSCSQLIISVHNTYLLNKEIWRPDEVWFTEKQPNGASDMYSLSQFRPRFDRTLEKDYYKGKYGAIPFFGKLRV